VLNKKKYIKSILKQIKDILESASVEDINTEIFYGTNEFLACSFNVPKIEHNGSITFVLRINKGATKIIHRGSGIETIDLLKESLKE